MPSIISEKERLRRWRIILGSKVEDETGALGDDKLCKMDRALEMLYQPRDEQENHRSGNLGGSSPVVNRWLGDIRTYFPTSVVRIMQRDALERLDLQQMLMEPELLESMEPDIHLVSTLISLKNVIPSKTKATARMVVGRLVDQLLTKLRTKTITAVRGMLDKASRTTRPRYNELDFHRTIRKNLKNWQRDKKFLIVDSPVGYGRKRQALKEIVLCVDQSGSMATSVVYSSIFAAVLASIHAVSVKLVVFDTAVIDLTEMLADPVDVLFGTQLGGGTDINQAIGYCETLITRPNDTIFVLITDLYEGGNANDMFVRVQTLVQKGVSMICLLALSDEGTPFYNNAYALRMASLGIPTFGCTPDLFPDLMAAAINHQNLTQWAGNHDINVERNVSDQI